MSEQPQWQRMRFKRNKVWLEIDSAGKPVMRDGKVRIKYQLDQSHEYWVFPASVTPLSDNGKPDIAGPALPSKNKRARPPSPPDDTPVTEAQCRQAICIYTDGACSGNPGPAGIGVILCYKDDRKEISHYIGQATNNIAELEAIRVGLDAVKNHNLPVIVFTDSNYAHGLLSRGWKAKQNQILVAEIKNLMASFKTLRFVKVKGHAGHPENERADRLAVKAIHQKTPNP
jgi:ribonuclease HI